MRGFQFQVFKVTHAKRQQSLSSFFFFAALVFSQTMRGKQSGTQGILTYTYLQQRLVLINLPHLHSHNTVGSHYQQALQSFIFCSLVHGVHFDLADDIHVHFCCGWNCHVFFLLQIRKNRPQVQTELQVNKRKDKFLIFRSSYLHIILFEPYYKHIFTVALS